MKKIFYPLFLFCLTQYALQASTVKSCLLTGYVTRLNTWYCTSTVRNPDPIKVGVDFYIEKSEALEGSHTDCSEYIGTVKNIHFSIPASKAENFLKGDSSTIRYFYAAPRCIPDSNQCKVQETFSLI